MEQICSQVHFVAPEIDAGAIILQAPVPVEVDDTVETLRERVKKVRCVVKNVELFSLCCLKSRRLQMIVKDVNDLKAVRI